MNKRKNSVFDGILGDNIILSSLMVISPIIICGDSVKNALSLIYAFNSMTFISLIIGSFVPKKIPYTIRIIIYAIISSLVFIPVRWFAVEFYPDSIQRIGIYYPLLAVNSLIVLQSEAKFYRMKKGRMIISLVFYIIGFDLVMLFTGAVREFFAYGTILSKVADINTTVSGLGMPFGGFIFLGLMCGVYRKIRSSVRSTKAESEE
ncbi:MAG: Electron transport complex protein RnfE [Firmicutes bacterium ADurb.BinA205]|nr:MAG: Electron transport complex protein RnfE [Firmicutes bacterium ADurb.BinA205]